MRDSDKSAASTGYSASDSSGVSPGTSADVLPGTSVEQIYGDIIDLPHHVSKTRPPMTMLNRAAQFAPFAALTGYEAAVEETARLTEDEVYLDESEIAVLNEKLARIETLLPQRPEVQITYFRPDKKKTGGSYETITEPVKRIDRIAQCLVMESGERIPLGRLMAIEGVF